MAEWAPGNDHLDIVEQSNDRSSKSLSARSFGIKTLQRTQIDDRINEKGSLVTELPIVLRRVFP
jgi:hypothetical protein